MTKQCSSVVYQPSVLQHYHQRYTDETQSLGWLYLINANGHQALLVMGCKFRSLSREGSLSCHTWCDTGLGFCGLIHKAAPFTRLVRQGRGTEGLCQPDPHGTTQTDQHVKQAVRHCHSHMYRFQEFGTIPAIINDVKGTLPNST